MARSPEQGDASSPQPTVSDFFVDKVGQLLKDNIDLVLTDAWDETSVEVLHLIDPNPKKGELLRYHHVYKLLEAEQPATHGILIARPYILKGQDLWVGESRHYFDNGQGVVVRKDRHWGADGYEFLTGGLDGPSEESELGLALNELQSDIFKIEQSEPLRPMSIVFREMLSHGLF